MRRISIILTLLALVACLGVKAQTSDSKIARLQADMYRLFSTNHVDSFNLVVEQLKEAAQQVGDERTFYKAWGNQAMYNFSNIGRDEGLEEIAKAREYAKQHNSKYGLLTSSYANASMLSTLKLYDQAEKAYREAIEYKETYFPDESGAAYYLGLAKLYVNQSKSEQVLECARKTLADPHLIPLHRLSAWSYLCIGIYISNSPNKYELFNTYYAEREKAKAVVGHDDNLGHLVDSEKAIINNDPEEALRQAEALPPGLNRLSSLHRALALMGRYKEAYEELYNYLKAKDSINNEEFKRWSSESAIQQGLVRMENEAKDLRLANQELELSKITSELEQQRLEAEANELKLKNQNAELERSAMQLEKATLDGITKELDLRQKLMDAEAQNQAERSRQQTRHFIYIIIGIVLASLAYIIYRRMSQVKQLKAKNDQLSQAYDQLEKTTSVKERIESELRIARDIQMSMVPSSFPSRSDLDIYAYMMPAKEVGGDLYSFVLEDSSLYFCIGDVSGKGVPASLFMAQTIRLFRMLAAQHLAPAAIATKMNNELAENNEQGMFVTMFIGQANLTNGQLDFCNCGHNPPVLGLQFLEVEPNAPLGLWSGLEYIGEHIEDIRHQRLFLYTDGLNEAEDVWHNQFGDDNIPLILEEHPAFSCQQTIDVMKQAVADHAGNAEPSDDLTMLCVKVMG